MPFALIIIGLALVITSAQDTYVQFGRQIKSDLIGPGGFIYWAASLGMAGSFGYIEPLRRFSTALMGLVLLVFLLKNKNFFANLKAGLAAKPVTPAKSDASKMPSISPASLALTLDKNTLNLGGNATNFGNWMTQLMTGVDPATAVPLTGINGVSVDDFLGAWRGPESGAF